MKNLFLIITIFLFINCSLFDPITLIVQNNSNYDIIVLFDKGIKNENKILKGKGKFFLFYPDNIKMTIKIEDIDFEREYDLKLEYKKNYQFEFKINK